MSGKHSGGSGGTMKNPGDWNGRNERTPTEELPKQKQKDLADRDKTDKSKGRKG